MELHQRGVDLLVNVMDAADNADQLTVDEIRRLLREVVEVMSLILERDARIALKNKER
jgi:Holliday junction resolvasome RuvABC ATP-dependent DNA helicase subunit